MQRKAPAGPERPLLLVLDDAGSPDARRLVEAVGARGSLAVIDRSSLASLEVGTEGVHVQACLGDAVIRPGAVLVWRLPQVCDHPRRDELMANPVAHSFHVNQWATMLHGLFLAWEFDGVPIVNGADVGRWDEKTAQLIVAASVGFRTPPTLRSARPEGIAPFLQAHGGAGITKAFIPFHDYDAGTKRAVRQLTREVTVEDVEARGEGAIPTAALYQPLVRSRAELRIVVVGDEVFAARFHRDEMDHVDSRHQEAAVVPASAYDVPDDLARRCQALLARCDLDMAVIDVLIDDDGEAVFLDLNPTGVFDWIACRFDLPIYPAVGRLLADLASGTASRRSTT
jgi:hypothetical protein